MKQPIPPLTAPAGYRPQSRDTSIAADLLEFYLLRQRTPEERLTMAANLTRSARQLSLHCLRQQFPQLEPDSFARKLAQAWLQSTDPPNFLPGGSPVSWIQDSTQLASQLHSLLEAQNIPYFVTGGVAATIYGEPRTTRDLDLVIAIAPSEISPLILALEQTGFYIPGAEEVIAGSSTTLQITHTETISRADLMLAGTDEYAQLELARRQTYSLPNGVTVYFASPEDLILSKLRWGQTSQSDKQWRDVLAICKVQQGALDYRYLFQWAERFGFTATLEQVLVEAGVRELAAQQLAQQ